MKCNYHTHTARCMHAVGNDEDYARAALAAGFDELGFSDHAPWVFRTDYVSHIRMKPEELKGYVRSVQDLRRRYAGRLSIRVGLEIEWVPALKDQYDRLTDSGIEYFILGQHYLGSEEDSIYSGTACQTDDNVKRYADLVTEAIATGRFRYVAHPDLYMRRRMRDFSPACEEAALLIGQAAREADLPLEYNLLGRSQQSEEPGFGYPHPLFWQTLEGRGNRTILGVDAHDPQLLTDAALWQKGLRDLSELGFTPEDHLPF